jgi:hypothetical protein
LAIVRKELLVVELALELVAQKPLLIRVKFVFSGILTIHIHANKEVMTM